LRLKLVADRNIAVPEALVAGAKVKNIVSDHFSIVVKDLQQGQDIAENLGLLQEHRKFRTDVPEIYNHVRKVGLSSSEPSEVVIMEMLTGADFLVLDDCDVVLTSGGYRIPCSNNA
jgi:hypothetical protein